MSNKKLLAQFYTPSHVANIMQGLLQNSGSLLEPAAGDGALLRAVKAVGNTSKVTAVEMDAEKAKGCVEYCDDLIVSDFFNIGLSVGHYDSIIMNPPYMALKKVPEQTLNTKGFQQTLAALGGYSNLYAHFILRCFLLLKNGGEMVAIVPDDVFKATGNAKLNTALHNAGTFTNIIKFKKSPFLPDAAQEVVVFRYCKGDLSRLTEVEII